MAEVDMVMLHILQLPLRMEALGEVTVVLTAQTLLQAKAQQGKEIMEVRKLELLPTLWLEGEEALEARAQTLLADKQVMVAMVFNTTSEALMNTSP